MDQKYMLCLVNVFFYDQLSLLKQFPEKVIHIVLDLLKPFWIILLKKKKNYHSEPLNYRAVARTTYFCKTMDNDR